MTLSDAQRLFAKTNYYLGAIDGLWGPKTLKAVTIIERNAGYSTSGWSRRRRWVAAAQTQLNAMGYEAGAVDGLIGHNTREALTGFLSDEAGVDWSVDRSPLDSQPSTALELPRQRDIVSYYGQPGTWDNQTQVELSFPMRIDYNLSQTTRKMTVHQKCADPLKRAMEAVHDHYGLSTMRTLGIDRYAGGYVNRKMRGGSSWSMHAYGCAIDLYAAPNGLRTTCPRALFCKPAYKPLLDIMESHGWLPAIRLWGKDAMHFQMARL